MWRLMASRICASNMSISRGRFTEISDCLRFTEESSTVILNPSCEQSPRPYPVIDFIVLKYGESAAGTRINSGEAVEQKSRHRPGVINILRLLMKTFLL